MKIGHIEIPIWSGTPNNPEAGTVTVYTKDDGLFYMRKSDGTEILVGPTTGAVASVNWGDISGSITSQEDLIAYFTNYSLTGHVHAISGITDLQTTLDTKSSTAHIHAISGITDLQTTLDTKSVTGHTHSASGITDLSGTLADYATTESLSGYVQIPSTTVALNEVALYADTSGSQVKQSGVTIGTGVSGGSLLGMTPYIVETSGLISNSKLYLVSNASGTFLKLKYGGAVFNVEMSQE